MENLGFLPGRVFEPHGVRDEHRSDSSQGPLGMTNGGAEPCFSIAVPILVSPAGWVQSCRLSTSVMYSISNQ